MSVGGFFNFGLLGAEAGGAGGGGGGTPVPGPEATAFLARTSGLDTTHVNAYTNLINGLVADALWTKFDVLHVYATQDAVTAALNLVATSFNGTVNGAPTFTADRGFTGVDASATIYIDTGFNGTTAPSPKYTGGSAHISFWQVNSIGLITGVPMGALSGTNPQTYVSNSASATFCINCQNTQCAQGITGSGGTQGHWISTRTSGPSGNAYWNGAFLAGIGSGATVPNLNFYSAGHNNGGTAVGCRAQVGQISIGSGLTTTDASKLYARLRTYMTAVGVP